MKVVIAVDSLKGSLSSLEAGQAVAEGIRRVFADAETVVRPLADGGEGTAEALTCGMGGRWREMQASGPLGEPIRCRYGILGVGTTAVMEMAEAAGLTRVPPGLRDPMKTTTYGVGEMIRDAIAGGCRRFLIGIGGSATNDGGIGMLQALGFGILDESGNPVVRGGRGLARVARITEDGVLPELAGCTFRIACDVTNPLCGPQGCSAVYGPQKGAAPDTIRQLDDWLRRFAEIAAKTYPHADPWMPSAGAAGGLGFAFSLLPNASLESGSAIVLEETRLEEEVKDADLVVTGEGCLDAQTVLGKAPAGVAKLARKYGKPVLAFAGCVSEDAKLCHSAGIDAYFPILRTVMTREEAMNAKTAGNNLTAAAEQVFRVIRLAREMGTDQEKKERRN